MKTSKITKPFAKTLMTAFGGETVSYSPRALKIAIGNTAVSVTQEQMDEIVESIGGKFDLIVKIYNGAMEY